MLRRKLSSSLLRIASTATPQAQASIGASLAHGAHRAAAPTQSAHLVSAVLLTSQKNWREETVASLKAELKRRGLSQTGNKATLITRLSSADASAHLPPVPPLPARPSAKSTTSTAKRGISSSRILAAGAPKTGETATSTGPEIASQRDEAPRKEAIEPEHKDTAPGLPDAQEASQADVKKGEELTPRIPNLHVQGKKAEQPVIPLEPDNFRTARPETPKETSSTESLPKVSTVTSADTLPGGGPSHAIHDTAVPSSSSLSEAEQSLSDLVGGKVDFPALTDVLSSIVTSPARGIRALGFGGAEAEQVADKAAEVKDKLAQVEINAPKLKGKEQTYKASDRPLEGEERTGAYILGGIVALGLLLGGGSSGDAKGKLKQAAHDAKAAVGGVKGDANWEKNSGAGIVGHGARKA